MLFRSGSAGWRSAATQALSSVPQLPLPMSPPRSLTWAPGLPCCPGGPGSPWGPYRKHKRARMGAAELSSPGGKPGPGPPAGAGEGAATQEGHETGATGRKVLFRSPTSITGDPRDTSQWARSRPLPSTSSAGDEDAVPLCPPGSEWGRASARPLLREAHTSRPRPLCWGGLSPPPTPCVAATTMRPWSGQDPWTYHVAFWAWLTVHSRHTLGGIETEKNQQSSTGKAQRAQLGPCP